ncbi:NADH-quinone oxidoreductase subunit N [Mucilaginibacter terrenus]|uniref:NADH-quinone oxidoreductase subunit N n=1 Tax=Mucilaginibacter terrenus TaxID=2482727 RepID=A0A3E2NXK9_9SPHI|nr:NADH-quinone oxidoreductase subunit N [Mucilaginibacter terrenus]RFZ85651.1 NADH-quinone oxidoreductase subunit N [Mucilaginibacter terrenus]
MQDQLSDISNQLSGALVSLPYLMPEVYITVLFVVVLLTDLLFRKNSAWLCRIVAAAGVLLVLFKDAQQFSMIASGPQFIFSGMLLLNHMAIIFKMIVGVLAFILLLYFSWDNRLKIHRKGLSDLYSIVTGSLLGLHIMVMAVNMLAMYLSVEMVSIASYLLVAYKTENGISAEAGLKYVLFGAASSAVMLYGISLVYAFTGELNLFNPIVVQQLGHVNQLSVSFAVMLILLGIGFKMSFIPAHFWVPDVYEGAATPITAYLSTLPKIAAFGLLVNFITPLIFYGGWTGFDIRAAFSVIGIVTMIGGNFAAVMQNNVKRMLAYSSIGHTGFALMAITTFIGQGIQALSYYLLVYGIANIAALALANYFENAEGITDVREYKGLGFKYPLASVAFVVVLVSLTGIPVSAGFTAKLFVFSALYGTYQHTHDTWLAALMAVGALVTVVSLFYYIKIPLNLFIRRSELLVSENKWSIKLVVLSTILAAVLLIFGIFPNLLIKYM